MKLMQVPEDGPFDEEVPRVSNFQEELDAVHWNESEVQTRRELAACNLRDGYWYYDRTKPLYTNSCQWARSPWNCRLNGRKDTTYEQWSWKPSGCNLPRFDTNYFLNKFRGKIVAFIGDSFANNMAESLMCILSRVTTVRRYINRFEGVRVQGMLAVDYDLKIITVGSAYLVKYSKDANDFSKLGLKQNSFYDYLVWTDQLDPQWTIPLKYFDVAIFMSGHWYQVALGNTVVRARTFLKKDKVLFNIPGIDAYHMSLEFIKRWILRRSGYKGSLFFVTFSPSHYSAQSNCRATRPLTPKNMYAYAAKNDATKWATMEKSTMGQSRFKVMDVTLMSHGRPDAHVATNYGKPANSKTRWDCTHWCLPGVPDVWNELLLYKMKTEL